MRGATRTDCVITRPWRSSIVGIVELGRGDCAAALVLRSALSTIETQRAPLGQRPRSRRIRVCRWLFAAGIITFRETKGSELPVALRHISGQSA